MADKSQGRGEIVDVVQRMSEDPSMHDMVTGGVDTSQMPVSDNVVDQGFWNKPWINPEVTDVTGRLRAAAINTADDIADLFWADDEPILFEHIQAPRVVEQYRDPAAYDKNPVLVELREGAPKEKSREEMLNSIDPLGTIQRAGPKSAGVTADEFFDDVDHPAPVVRGAINVDPDQEVRKRALAKEMGLPVETINDDNIEELEKAKREKDIGAATEEAPSLFDMMGDPTFAAVAHDSVESLAEIEKGLDLVREKPRTWTETFGNGFAASIPSLKLSVAGAIGATADASELGEALVNQRPFGSFGLDAYAMKVQDEDVAKAHEAAKTMAIDAFENLQALTPGESDGLLKQYAFDLTMGLANMVPTIATTMATGSPGMGAMIMGGQVYGSKYAESRYKDGRSEQEAREDAAFWAVAEGIPEYIPLAALLKGGKFVGAGLLKEMGLEGVTEMMTQVLQDGYDVAVHGKDMTWGQFVKDVLYAGSVGAGMGGGMYIGTAPFRGKTDDDRAANAERASEQFTKVMEQAKSTALAQRDPEAAIQHMNKALADRGLDSLEISVPGMDAALGEEADAFYASMGLSPAQVEEARRLGSDVTIVSEMVLRHVAELDEAGSKQIMDHVRFERDAMTAAEAAEYEQEKEELAKIEDEPTEEEEAAVEEPKEAVAPKRADEPLAENTDAKAPAEPAGEPKAEAGGEGGGTVPPAAPPAAPAPEKPKKPTSRWLPNRQPPADEAQAVAEEQVGMEALFNSAQEAGMTEQEYAGYLAAIEQRKVASQNRTEILRLREQERELTAEWKVRRTQVEAEVKAQLGQEPVYRASQGLATVRLDRDALAAIVGEENMDKLPKQGKRRMWASGKEVGMDPDAYAELYGFKDAGTMLRAITESTPFQDAVNMAVYTRMMRENGDLSAAHKEVRLALEGLQNDNAADVMALELALLKLDKKSGSMTPAKVMAEGRRRMKSQKIKKATPNRYFSGMRRAGKLAGKIVRSGEPRKKGEARKPYDRSAAYKAKFQQLLNFQMAREAYKVQAMFAKEMKKLQKFARINGNKMQKLQPEYREAMAGLFNMIRLDREVGPHRGFDFAAWNNARLANGQKPVEFPASILANKGVRFVEDLTVGEFEDLVDAAKAIYTAGLEDNALFNKELAAGRDEAAMEIRELARKNLKDRRPPFRREHFTLHRKIGHAFGTLLTNEDTTFSFIDGKLWGRTYELIKRPIDRAMSYGYLPGRKGLVRAKQDFGDRVNALWDRYYTGKERLDMMYKEHQIPGVSKPISREYAIAVILNSGNQSNTEALLESGVWTQAEIDAIRNWVDKKDLDFAQGVWDLLDSYWPDIKATQERRHEPLGEKIEGEAFDTPHGRYRGGYYPLEYRSSESVNEYDHTPVAELIKQGIRPGSFLRQTTQDGFTKARKGSGGNPVNMNLSVFVRHGNRVIYDLEMGDAVADAWRIWNSKINQETFKGWGQDPTFEHIKMFLENMITGELHLPDIVNRTARFAKAGLTVGKLGFNVKTMIMQPLGLMNSMIRVSPRAQMKGVMALLTSNPKALTDWINEDPLMQQRSHTFNESMQLAIEKMSDAGWVKRLTGGRDTKAFLEAAFFGIKKLQKLTDNLTYLMAYNDGEKLYPGDPARAREYAGRVVIRTQGSGNFNERTPLERGVYKRGMEQSDFIRAWNPMINFFAARYSMMVEQGRLAKGSPVKMAQFIAAYTTLFTIEAMATITLERWLAAALKGALDDEDDEDLSEEERVEKMWAWWEEVAERGASSAVAGIPFLRDIGSELKGFSGGGAVVALGATFAKALGSGYDLIAEGKVNKTLFNNVTNLFGFFGLPLAPTQSYASAIYRYIHGPQAEEDQSYLDMLMDVQEE